MAGPETTILFKAEVDSKGAISGLKQVEASLGGVGSQAGAAQVGVSRLGSGLSSGAAALGLYAAGAFTVTKALGAIKDTIGAAAQAQLAQVKLEAIVKATGGAAGHTAEQLARMATSMQMLTGINDETVKQAQAVLLTYRSIGPQAFEPALKAAANLAAIMDGDLVGAARSVGMAMEDPAEGMLRLRRSGLLLSETVKAQIIDLQAHGQLLEAQQLLLAEVAKRADELAEKMGNTFTGSLRKVAVAWGDVREEMGAFVTDSKAGVDSLTDIATLLEKAAQNVKALRAAAGGAGAGGFILNALGFGGLQQAQALLAILANRDAGYTAAVPPKAKPDAWAFGPFGQDYAEQIAAGQRAIKEANAAAQEFNSSLEGQATAVENAATELIKFNAALRAQNDLVREAFKNNRSFQGPKGGYWDKFGIGQAEVDPDLAARTLAQAKTAWEAKGTGNELGQAFGHSFADAFITVFSGDKVEDAFAGLLRGFSGMAARSIGDALGVLMSGGSPEAAGIAGNLWQVKRDAQGNVIEGSGKFNTMGAVGMMGGILGQIGQAKQNRGMATAGGAVSGMAAGAMYGAATFNVVGAVIGAVIGGLMGYLGSKGPSAESAQMGLGGGRGYVYEITGGVNKEAEAQVAAQITDRYRTTALAFRDVLYSLGEALGSMPDVTLAFSEKSKNLESAIQAFISSTVPRAVFATYKDALAEGLEAVGVSTGRIGSELGKFSTGDFDKALAAFQAYVMAVLDTTKLHKELGKSMAEVQADLAKGMVETWRDASVKTLENLSRLSEGLDQLTSEEQVARAQEIAQAAREGLDVALALLKNVEDTRKGLAESLDAFQLARTLAGTSGPAAQVDIFKGRFAGALAGAAGAQSTEALSKFMGEALGYGQQLVALADQIEAQAVALRGLSDEFKNLTADLAKPVSEIMAGFAVSGREAFMGTNSDAVARILDLRAGIEGLAPGDLISRLGTIRDLTRTTLENNLDYLRDIAAAQESVKATFEGFFQSIAESEAGKQGPAAQGQYYVDQLAALQGLLNAAADPAVIRDLMERAAGFGSKLYGMAGQVQVGGQDVLAWLKPFMEMLQAAATTKLGTEAGLVEGQNKGLAGSIAGLQLTIDTGATGLQAAAENLRKLVDEQLAAAMTTADALLDQWAGEVEIAIQAMDKFVGGILAALTGENAAELGASLKGLGDAAGGAKDGLDALTGAAMVAARVLAGLGGDDPGPGRYA